MARKMVKITLDVETVNGKVPRCLWVPLRLRNALERDLNYMPRKPRAKVRDAFGSVRIA